MSEGRKDFSTYFRGPVQTPFSMLFGRSMVRSPVRTERQEKEVLAEVRRVVGARYLVRDVRIDDQGVYMSVLIDPDENAAMFEEVRLDLKGYNLYPRLVESEGKYVIAIFPSNPRGPTRYTANIVMFLLTVLTTVWAGAILWAGRSHELSDVEFITVLIDPVPVLLGGLTFAFPLLLILGSHELGHYFVSRIYKVDASLPYFIPIPPLFSPFGTFGALISMRENISNKRALVDIGAAGPIAGFLVAIPVTVLGLVLTNQFPAHEVEMVDGGVYMAINPPLLFDLLSRMIGVSSEGTIFPTALAGWIGLFVTALNLFPVGQLDGGHIVRGIFGRYAHYISYATVGVLIVLGFVTSFMTYLIFAVLILFMGARHPPPLDDVSPVRPRQVVAFAFAVLMMAVTFHPVPIEEITYEKGEIAIMEYHSTLMVGPEVPGICSFTVVNQGAHEEDVDISIHVMGERLVPSILPQTPSGFDTLLSGGDSIVASFERSGLHLYLLDTLGQTIDSGGSATWRLAARSDMPFDEMNVTQINVTFVAGDLSRTAMVSLSPVGDAIMMDHRMLDTLRGTKVEGRIVLVGGPGEVNVSIDYDRASSPYRVFLKARNGIGTWSQPEAGTTLDVTPRAIGPNFTLKIVPDDAGMAELPFTIEFFLVGKDPQPLEMSIMFVGSNTSSDLSIGAVDL